MKLKSMVFNVGTPLLLALCLAGCAKDEGKKVVCWGDSLTAPNGTGIKGWVRGLLRGKAYPEQLQGMMGGAYEVVNAGVGGENTLTIMARQGAFPMKLAHDVVIYRTDETKFSRFIGGADIPAFHSTYNDKQVTPLKQRGWKEGTPVWINPCYIGGYKCLLKSESKIWQEDGKYVFEYNYFIEPLDELAKTDTLPAGTVIETDAMRTLRNAYANVFFMGQNGGFIDAADLIRQYRAMIDYSRCERFVIISFHKPNRPLPTVRRMEEMEDSLRQAFGPHLINLRKYMVENALSDAGIEADQTDKDSIAHGQVPPCLLRDGLHFTSEANTLIARLVEKKFKELGY